MLSMTTSQVGHPIALFVLMKPDHRLIHVQTISSLRRWKRPFRPHIGRIEIPNTGEIGIKCPEIEQAGLYQSEFHEFDAAVPWIEPADIELSNDIETICGSSIDIPAADAACVGKQVARGQAPV
jgi:hypothetical protein